MDYKFNDIEKKWQDIWEETGYNNAVDFHPTKPKFYILYEFMNNSGKAHLGGVAKACTPADAYARFKRFCGYNVLFPFGLDEFGTPGENYAIKTGNHPESQMALGRRDISKACKAYGISYDYTRGCYTSDPNYYKWTQWLFKQFFVNKMAEKATATVNYCEGCKSIISNEDLEGSVCERCGTLVEQRERSVWFLKMKQYAQKCLDATEAIKMKEPLKAMQRNWIGKSQGVQMQVDITDASGKKVGAFEIFTTCPETIYGVTFMSIAPESKIVDSVKPNITNGAAVEKYRTATAHKTELDRKASTKKTGVKLEGVFAVNPINNARVPIYLADFVLANYGTGAVMAVPSHDQRDYDFAVQFKIPMQQIIEGDCTKQAVEKAEYLAKNSKMINSDIFTGLPVSDAKQKIIKKLVELKVGKVVENYSLTDWSFNRQRYWGEPFPMLYCDKCGWVALDDNNLPLELPYLKDYAPRADGSSPLSKATDWLNCTCPKCNGKAVRESDTMPNWAGSSWYWLRFMDPHNKNEFASKEHQKYWGMVDMYLGGNEHVCRHILYAYFWQRFLYDVGLAYEKYPFIAKRGNGLLLNSSGKKLSKRDGGYLQPEEYAEKYSADAIRMHTLYLGGHEDNVVWTEEGLNGVQKLLNKIWNLQTMVSGEKATGDAAISLNEFVEFATNALENFEHNTLVAKIFEFINRVYKSKTITKEELKAFLICANPIIPHITSEVYQIVFGKNITVESWVKTNSKLKRSTVTIAVQINGKTRTTVEVPVDASEKDVLGVIAKTTNISVDSPKKVIYVKGRIINIIM